VGVGIQIVASLQRKAGENAFFSSFPLPSICGSGAIPSAS